MTASEFAPYSLFSSDSTLNPPGATPLLLIRAVDRLRMLRASSRFWPVNVAPQDSRLVPLDQIRAVFPSVFVVFVIVDTRSIFVIFSPGTGRGPEMPINAAANECPSAVSYST